MTKTIGLNEVSSRSVGDLLRDVVADGDVLRIRLSDDDTVELRSVGKLQPLITFDGYVPEGWKDVIYSRQ